MYSKQSHCSVLRERVRRVQRAARSNSIGWRAPCESSGCSDAVKRAVVPALRSQRRVVRSVAYEALSLASKALASNMSILQLSVSSEFIRVTEHGLASDILAAVVCAAQFRVVKGIASTARGNLGEYLAR